MIPGIPDVAIGATLAAFIAGIVSLIGLVVAKENKTSEFRQAWIDELRDEIALLIAHANAIHGSTQAGWLSKADAWKDVRNDFVGINEAAGKIRLRLNTEELPSRVVLGTIEELEKLLAPSEESPDHRGLNLLEKRLVKEANVILKSEWERVKVGEWGYRIFKYASLVIVLMSIGASVFFLTHSSPSVPVSTSPQPSPQPSSTGGSR